jgi:hypothetical protein
MRRIFKLLLLLVLLFSFQPARAQGQPSLASTEVWIWPEYDEPSVLVIQRMVVSPSTSLPATMTFRIPAGAEKPTALAVGQTPDTVADTPYTLEPDGKWVKVVVQVTAPAIQMEYYDPAITRTGKNRDFLYEWPGDYAMSNFHVQLQQPFDATSLQTTPNLPDTNTVPDGLTYYSGDFGALALGQTFSLDVTYQKDTDALSVSFMNVQAAAPVDESTAGRISFGTYLPWLIAAVGVLMISGGLYYYFRGGARPRPNVRRRHVASVESTAEGQIYCPQCGTRARNGDRFCRTCGTRLRVEAEE